MPTLWQRLLKSGGKVWYTILVLSFLFGILNPFVILGYILHLHVQNGYSGGLGLTLTAVSYLASLIGFLIIERIAYLDRNVRSLEVASIMALPIAFVAFLAGMVAPATIMWPLAGGILLTSIGGLHAADSLMPATPTPEPGKPKSCKERPESGPATTTAATHKRNRRRPRARRRAH